MKLIKSTSLLFAASIIGSSQVFAINNISRVSVDTGIGPNPNPNGASTQSAVSADGRYVAFESYAQDLVVGDTNTVKDIFRYDRENNTTIRVSVSTGGTEANDASVFSDMSDDGRYIVFASRATNLTADTYPTPVADPDNIGSTIQPKQIFLRDTQTNTTTLISKVGGTSASTDAANNISNRPVISADGRYIAYESLSSDINANDTDVISDIFRYDTVTDATVLVSVNTSGDKGNALSVEAAISDDGRYIAFASNASNLGGLITDAVRDVFYRDMDTSTTTAVTANAPGISGLTDSQQPAISADGRYIVFESFRDDLTSDTDTNVEQDIFLFDTSTSTTTLLSKNNSTGDAANGRSGHAAISSDGRYVVFESIASDLTDGDTNGVIDIFLVDLALNTLERVSRDVNGAEGTSLSEKPRISTNGRFLIFTSANDFVTDDTNVLRDIYLFQRSLHAAHDINGDNRSDIVWRNENPTTGGFNWGHTMNGATITAKMGINFRTTSDYIFGGIGDFNNDGIDDFIWRDNSGDISIDLYDGTSVTQTGASGASDADLNWEIIGVGDFNDDGYDDLVWQNSSTEEVRFTLLKEFTQLELTSFGTLPTGFRLAGIGDFNGDGKEDLLWRNINTGVNWIHHLDGTALKSQGFSSLIASQNWQVSGVGDLDGDDRTDIVWRNGVTGYYRIHLIDGTGIKSNLAHVRNTNTDWDIKLVGDFDGDGQADIFQRNGATGANWLKIMNNGLISSSQAVSPILNTDFSPIHAD